MTDVADAYLEERKAEILGAARTVFVRRGFERATMQEIADQVGLSAGAIYRYFPSKESLITAACSAAAQGYLSALDGDDDPRGGLELLIGGGRAVWDELFGPGGHDALRMNLEASVAGFRAPEVIGTQVREQMTTEIDQLAGIIERAQHEGSLSADIDPTTLGTVLLAVTQGTHLLNAQLEDGVDIDAVWYLLVRMVGGLSAPTVPTQ